MEGYASDSRNPYGRVSQEIRQEQRLERESRECIGTLGSGSQRAKVEVWYVNDVGYERAGHFLCRADEGDDPWLVSQELVEAEAERRGWDEWEITDTYSA